MLAQSMTGFGQGENEGEKYLLNVEIKSVNHRFKDIRFKMGSLFNSKEIEFRKKIESSFKRGSFDIYITYKKKSNQTTDFDLDYSKMKSFIDEMSSQLGLQASQLQISPTDFLRNDFYKEDEDKKEEITALAEPAIIAAITSLEQSRNLEGKKLLEKLREHLDLYETHYFEVLKLKGDYQPKVKEKLLKRFESDGKDLNVDEPRFLQEVIYYLEKLDIDEETNRIKIHLDKLKTLISGEKNEVGRQIDFLMQELNRETNTIGSKSGAEEISENIVQMKVQLEKIREQALNLQ